MADLNCMIVLFVVEYTELMTMVYPSRDRTLLSSDILLV